MVEILTAAYFSVGLFVFYKGLEYHDKKYKDGDPEGFHALVSLGIACVWPISVTIIVLYRVFFG